jgi:hypothetical protein
MKQLKRFAAACILIASLSAVAFAGEMPCPPGEMNSPPGETQAPPGDMQGPGGAAPGEMNSPPGETQGPGFSITAGIVADVLATLFAGALP